MWKALLAALVVTLIGAALQATPARANDMYLDFAQTRLSGSWDDCMARVRRALPAEGWDIGGEYGAPVRGGYFVAWQDSHGVIVVCDIEPAGGTIVHMTMSGFDEGNKPLIDALIARIRGSAPSTGTPPPTGAGARAIDWKYYPGTDHRGMVGQRFTYSCPPNGTLYAIWGTDIYTDDSSVCTAAVHAGLISIAQGGTVTIEMLGGQSSYRGSTRHGVSSRDWSSTPGAYKFAP
jgi:hypothetical protein